MMFFIELVEALRDAKARLAKAQEAARIAAELPALQDEVRGLELAVARQNGTPQPDPSTWTELSRSKAILRVLEASETPLGPAQIARTLANHGRKGDEPNYVSSTLDNLKRRGKVRSVGVGKWIPSDRRVAAEKELLADRLIETI